MAKLLFERALHRNPDSGQIESYWPDRWPVSLLADELFASGSAFFAASYMNDPSALEGNSLKMGWLKPYLPGELDAARAQSGFDRGTVHVGFDPTHGGKGVDPDFFALMSVEVIRNRGYLTDFHFGREGVDTQPQSAENWFDTVEPNLVLVEETAAEGFVYTALTTQINNQKGSKWPVVTRKPQSARDKGGKAMRFQSMAARFENGQVKVPGILDQNNQIIIDPRWDAFLQQWRLFPAGHDDILDACYWCMYDAFTEVEAAGVTKGVDRTVPATEVGGTENEPDVVVLAKDLRGRVRRPIGDRRQRRRIRLRDV